MTSSIIVPSRRRSRVDKDAYYTPTKLARAYFTSPFCPLTGKRSSILECCDGDGAISDVLRDLGYKVEGTDIRNGDQYDATKQEYWIDRSPDWVISNPPFDSATPIIRHALKSARLGVIMLLRSSFLEPCKDRRDILNAGISSICPVNPRPKFRTDLKSTDSSTVSFVAWRRQGRSTCAQLSFLTDWHL